MPDDFELLRAWQAGDEDSGNALFERHFAGLARFFRNKVGDRFEDLVQKTLLVVLEKQEEFRGDASFRTYLFSVAHNVLRNEVRALQRERDRFDPASQSVEDLGLTAGSLVDKKRERQLVLAGLRRIPLDLQVVLELYYWEQMQGEQIAAVLGLPHGTVRSRIRRGQEALRKALGRMKCTEEVLESTMTRLDEWAAQLRASVVPAGAEPQ